MSKSIIQARLICGLLGHRPNLLPVGDQAGAFYAHDAPMQPVRLLGTAGDVNDGAN